MPTRVLAILAAVSFALTLWRWIVSLRFPVHRRDAARAILPGVTFLKPLKGCDAETRNCLRSWFLQNYPGPVQLLFGVASPEDPVRAVVRELLEEFPGADARLIVCGENLGANAKVSTLRQLEPHCRHELVMISDADARVPPDFAACVAPLLEAPATGLVNCFYCLATASNAAMQWEAVAINSDFWTQVLQSRGIRPVDFALGAVMSLRSAELRAVGGFASLSDYLADDYQLGRLVARDGKRIEFTTVVAECCDPPMGWAQVLAHQSRWARTIRVCQPAPFFMSILGNATLWPALLLLDTWQPLAVCGAAFCLFFRIVTAALQQSKLTRSRRHLPFFWMPILKDILDVLIWAAAFTGNKIVWRGERYRVLKDGKLRKL